MIPALDAGAIDALDLSLPRAPVVRETAAPESHAATISTVDGKFVVSGMARIEGGGADWRGTLTQLDRPGLVASMYSTGGIREVLLRLGDGRSARARITGTSFIVSSERICELAGLERLR